MSQMLDFLFLKTKQTPNILNEGGEVYMNTVLELFQC